MKKPADNSKNQLTILILLVIVLIIIFCGGWFLKQLSSPVGEITDISFNNNKYSMDIRRTEGLLSFYQNDPLAMAFLLQVKRFIILPLDIGQLGKQNPFELPTPPEESLIEQLTR